MRRRLALFAALAVVAAGCAASGQPDSGTSSAGPRIVATTSILGELVTDLVGDEARVEVLIAPGQDPHGFAPSARQAQAMRESALVVANGLQLEEGLLDVLAAVEDDGVPVVRLADRLDPIPPAGAAEDHDHAEHDHGDAQGDHTEEGDHEGHDHGALDPHVWFDPVRMADGARLLAERLADAGIGPDVDWAARGAAVAEDLMALHDEVAEVLAPVPDACRRLVTNHDSLGYLASRYDFEVVGSVAPGTSSQADPSAREFAALAGLVRETGVPAVFVEVGESRRLAEALAEEVDREVEVVELYTGGLGAPGSGAEDYAGMLTTDARRIADALADC